MSQEQTARKNSDSSAAYLAGLGNHVSTEAVPGALPIGQNSPQQVPFGLYAEQISGTAFTAPRAENRHTWLYRRRPMAGYPAYRRHADPERFAPAGRVSTPNRLRWDPLPWPAEPKDFLDGLTPYGGAGEPGDHGLDLYCYAATTSMERIFLNCDGEMLVVPQEGALRIETELGIVEVAPLHIAVIPRGLCFRVRLLSDRARGYVCENHGAAFRLPDLGPIGANGLANPRDFETPVAWFEEQDRPTELVQKFQGRLWHTVVDHCPFDVVAWHGNLAPYRYDLTRFNTINTVSFDHPDPSIFTVLTSPSDRPGTANCDFAIFPPRWMVAEHSFRPPYFHRNVMSEFMGLIHGAYDAKEGGFLPGGASLHNKFSGHGPDRASYEKALAADLVPHHIDATMAFMFESGRVIEPTQLALDLPGCQDDYDECWSGLVPADLGKTS